MRRALFVIHGPTFGGAHMQLVRLSRPFEEHGWETLAALPEEPGNAVSRLREAGIEVAMFPLHRLRATVDPRPHARLVAGFRSEVRAIRRLIAERGVDLVQVHGPTNPHAGVAAHLEGAAVVWQLLDTRAPMALRRVTMPVVTRLADAVTTWGHALAEEHPGALALGDRLLTVTPPVDAVEFAGGDRQAARAELDVPEAACAIGAVGVRNPQKGHEYLVRAGAQVRAAHPEAVVRVIGAASAAHPEYDRRVREEAQALGLDGSAFGLVDPGGRVPQLLPGLDVFALTSVPRSEGMPTVILEAMASGLPVVATDVGAVAELVEHGVTGFVVPAEAPAAIADALGRLVSDPDLRRSMGAEGRRRAVERYGLDRVAEVHLRAFEIALAHRRSRGGRRRRVADA